MDIKPITKGSAGDKPFNFPSFLPKKAFMMSIIGMRGSGKSVLLSNLLEKYFLKEFDYIVIMCPSLNLNDDYDWIDSKPESIRKKVHKFSNPKEYQEIIKEIMDSQKKIIKHDSRKDCPNTLLILDDCIGEGVFHFRGIIDTLATKGRHMKISCVLTSQYLNGVSKTIRLNSELMVLFPCINQLEIEQFLEQYSYKKYRKKLNSQMERIFSEPYNFITINNSIKGERIFEGFDKIIDYKN